MVVNWINLPTSDATHRLANGTPAGAIIAERSEFNSGKTASAIAVDSLTENCVTTLRLSASESCNKQNSTSDYDISVENSLIYNMIGDERDAFVFSSWKSDENFSLASFVRFYRL